MYCFNGNVSWYMATCPLYGDVNYSECSLMEVPLYFHVGCHQHIMASSTSFSVWSYSRWSLWNLTVGSGHSMVGEGLPTDWLEEVGTNIYSHIL